MIELARGQAQLAAPVERVFAYLTDMTHYAQWFPDVRAISAVDDSDCRQIGKRYRETLILPGGEVTLGITVVQCERNRLFLTQGDLPGVLPQMRIRFRSAENATCHIHVVYHSRAPGLEASSAVIQALSADLGPRLAVGLANLRERFDR